MIYLLSSLRRILWIWYTLLVLGGILLFSTHFWEAKADENPPPHSSSPSVVEKPQTHLKADQLTHDQELDIVTARGHVEITHGKRTVTADTVSYQRSLNRLTATGDVTLADVDGTVTQTNYAELTGDLKEGFIRRARILFTNGAHATVRQGTRTGGTATILQDASYSACRPCSDQSLLWRVRAKEVMHDQRDRVVSYKNAWLEMRDIPIFYTPYLSQPDPSVKRQSGLLTPSYNRNKDLGFNIKIPWFYTISDHQDLTVAPIITSKEGLVLTAAHRVFTQKTALSGSASLTKDSQDAIRGHVSGTLRHSINKAWRTGLDLQLTSDRTYLRRYRFGSSPFLKSRAYVEGFTRRSYVSVEGIHFQNTGAVKTSEQDIPAFIPLGTMHYTSQPDGPLGTWTTFDLSLAGLHWKAGKKSQRVSSHIGWHVPYTSSGGSVYRLDLGLHTDTWHVNRIEESTTGMYTGAVARIVPEAAATWSLPLHRSQGKRSDVLEPIIQGVISPRGGNTHKIPNKDSLDFEINDSNLFSSQRATGRDRVENGPRFNYGLRYTAYGTALGTIETVFGQSWRAYPDTRIPVTSGLNKNFSDYVGRITTYPHQNFSASWRFRLDQETGALRRSDASINAEFSALETTIGYVERDELVEHDSSASSDYQRHQEIYGSVESQLSSHWKAATTARWDTAEGGGPLKVGGEVSYEDECFVFTLEAGKDYTRDGDFSGGTFIGLTLSFKTLGDLAIKL